MVAIQVCFSRLGAAVGGGYRGGANQGVGGFVVSHPSAMKLRKDGAPGSKAADARVHSMMRAAQAEIPV